MYIYVHARSVFTKRVKEGLWLVRNNPGLNLRHKKYFWFALYFRPGHRLHKNIPGAIHKIFFQHTVFCSRLGPPYHSSLGSPLTQFTQWHKADHRNHQWLRPLLTITLFLYVQKYILKSFTLGWRILVVGCGWLLKMKVNQAGSLKRERKSFYKSWDEQMIFECFRIALCAILVLIMTFYSPAFKNFLGNLHNNIFVH